MVETHTCEGFRPPNPPVVNELLREQSHVKNPEKNSPPGMDEYGRTPLWNFAFAGNLDAVRKDLDSGANPNQGDDNGLTPLHIAIQEKHFEVIKHLLERKADPNQKDKHGNVPLWTAVHKWDRTNQIILLLLSFKADAHIENNF